MTDRKKEVEAYTSYFRTKMGESLTDAVAQVAAKRPKDPIEFLASALYKSRNMKLPTTQVARDRRLQMPVWKPGESGSAISVPEVSRQERKDTQNVPVTTSENYSTNSQTKYPGHENYVINYEDDDVDQDYDLGETVVYVHEKFLSLFKVIGDLFDDEKVS